MTHWAEPSRVSLSERQRESCWALWKVLSGSYFPFHAFALSQNVSISLSVRGQLL